MAEDRPEAFVTTAVAALWIAPLMTEAFARLRVPAPTEAAACTIEAATEFATSLPETPEP